MKYQLRRGRKVQGEMTEDDFQAGKPRRKEVECAAMYAAIVRKDGDTDSSGNNIAEGIRPTNTTLTSTNPSLMIAPSVSVTGTGEAMELITTLRRDVVLAGIAAQSRPQQPSLYGASPSLYSPSFQDQLPRNTEDTVPSQSFVCHC